jgi:hypothetical protein
MDTQGMVLWSKRKQVSFHQLEHIDVVTYQVPVRGSFDRNRAIVALGRRLNRCGKPGSYYVSTIMQLGEYDDSNQLLEVSLISHRRLGGLAARVGIDV